ncbi:MULTISPECIES: cytochrome c biogenesis protein [Pelosinus]|uniref:Heme exporter protein C n=1 Tax=Pelosinus fermentans B4 TaxID=1149862 RepID=I9LCB7_9FIRM|nr:MULTISPECIES: cytochrome c biogenesis protein CcsA [Pelosinus]EIW17976.1 cytochrome c assembly protein [Pelosinus fermentans B4]EIW23938.1 cytochrome c assembly protein [Pelosinus fermentans A11]OAM94861.1 cytochrome c assembly protein [Pelosinus fermentans DSM 17108]SDR19165.1 heme exporter protein C [Pelosinus fermentans]
MKLVLLLWIMGVIYAVLYIVPPAEGLGELVRIAFFHIPVAWVSILAFLLSAGWSIQYLRTRDIQYDWKSSAAASLGLLFCLLATISGAIFAKLTWGAYWNWDPRQTSIFILLLIYGAYLVLRSSIQDEQERAKISAVYASLSFLTVPFLVFIIPRFYFSLHPEPVINSGGKLEMDTIMIYVLLAAVGACTALFWQCFNYMVHNKQKSA